MLGGAVAIESSSPLLTSDSPPVSGDPAAAASSRLPAISSIITSSSNSVLSTSANTSYTSKGIVVISGKALRRNSEKKRVWFVGTPSGSPVADFTFVFNSPWPANTGTCFHTPITDLTT